MKGLPETGAGRSASPAAATSGIPDRAVSSGWAARFGRVILEHGVATIPAALFHYQGGLHLTAQDVWFISYILAHKWQADLPYPSLTLMAAQTGVGVRQLQYIRAALERQQ